MWRLIESAPRDGTLILVYDANNGFNEGPKDEEYMYLVQYTFDGERDGQDWRISIDGQCMLPTHWMPLPNPPEADNA